MAAKRINGYEAEWLRTSFIRSMSLVQFQPYLPNNADAWNSVWRIPVNLNGGYQFVGSNPTAAKNITGEYNVN